MPSAPNSEIETSRSTACGASKHRALKDAGFRETVPFALLAFSQETVPQARGIFMINFISDVRRKSLFYLRKPNFQP
jgi:hypothetical protein